MNEESDKNYMILFTVEAFWTVSLFLRLTTCHMVSCSLLVRLNVFFFLIKMTQKKGNQDLFARIYHFLHKSLKLGDSSRLLCAAFLPIPKFGLYCFFASLLLQVHEPFHEGIFFFTCIVVSSIKITKGLFVPLYNSQVNSPGFLMMKFINAGKVKSQHKIICSMSPKSFLHRIEYNPIFDLGILPAKISTVIYGDASVRIPTSNRPKVCPPNLKKTQIFILPYFFVSHCIYFPFLIVTNQTAFNSENIHLSYFKTYLIQKSTLTDQLGTHMCNYPIQKSNLTSKLETHTNSNIIGIRHSVLPFPLAQTSKFLLQKLLLCSSHFWLAALIVMIYLKDKGHPKPQPHLFQKKLSGDISPQPISGFYCISSAYPDTKYRKTVSFNKDFPLVIMPSFPKGISTDFPKSLHFSRAIYFWPSFDFSTVICHLGKYQILADTNKHLDQVPKLRGQIKIIQILLHVVVVDTKGNPDFWFKLGELNELWGASLVRRGQVLWVKGNLTRKHDTGIHSKLILCLTTKWPITISIAFFFSSKLLKIFPATLTVSVAFLELTEFQGIWVATLLLNLRPSGCSLKTLC
ncbi:hypothetical protein VP01_3568g1 [Puccinia sorghi]|uniref:Uncharacterized protein n=1 Tax=Puccinia sorghi TaxID=27349 RepID=A0A0L6UW55_9BASI|nr:hypothetical protein VP01_3568g1 [Puccinia sorghi]